MRENRTVRSTVSGAARLAFFCAVVLGGCMVPVTTVGRAFADGPGDCPEGTAWNPTLGACIQIEIPGDPGDPGGPDPGTGGTVCRDQSGGEVPCSKNGLSWWGSPHWCYAEPDNPQGPPPPGHEDDGGMWWTCMLTVGAGAGTAATWWVVDGNAPVDPAAVAATLRVQLPYELANAQVAPPSSYHTYISYKNWLWVPGTQWRTVSATEALRGATVTLTATPSYTSWDMGNGTNLSCVGPGREWTHGMPENAPTNCSYAYKEMQNPNGDTWTVTARINYTLTWSCTGNCGGAASGDLGEQLAAAGASTTVTVYQRQTVVTG